MTASVRWMCRGLIVGVALLATPWVMAQEAERPAPAGLVLKPSGLLAGDAPEAIVPSGAVVHVRIKSAELLLNDLSAMATKFIPEKALPPDRRKLLDGPNPLLALIGMQTTGRPLTVPMLAEQSGLDLARPVTLSVYAQGTPDKSFILTLPVRDMKALSRMLAAFVNGAEEVALEGGSALHIQIEHNDLFLVCSERVVCACGSKDLAQMLLSAPREGRLDRSEMIGRGLREHADDNLVIVADAEPIKPMLMMLRQMSAVPEPMVADLRKDMLRGVSAKDLANFNSQLSKRLNIRDVEQLMDICEVVALGTYEALAEAVLSEADNFQGIVIAADVGADMQRFHLTVYSRSITPGGKPLPLAEAAKAVPKLPGTHNYLMLQGQSAAPAKSKLLGDIIERIAKRAQAKDLPKAFAQTLQKAYAEYQPEPTLDSKVPWSVTTRAIGPKSKGPDAFPSLQKYWESVYANMSTPVEVATIQAIPKQQEDFLTAHYKQASEASNNNDRIYRLLRERGGFGAPSYERESRFAVRKLDGGVLNMVRETSYTTRWGFFGFNEHELINREFTLCRDVGDLTLLCPGGADPSVLSNFQPQRVPAAIKRLVTELRAPADANRIELLRVATSVLDTVDLVALVETLAHKELTDYLAKVNAVRKAGGEDDETLSRLRAIEMPALVHHLKQNKDGSFYVSLPGGLTFPRPKVMPEVLALLDEYRKAVDAQGGMAVYQRQAAGRFDVVTLHSTEALATLVRTVGNRVVEKYLSNQEEMQRVQGLFHNELDQAARRHPTVLSNPTWDFIPSDDALSVKDAQAF
ncbi:MAG: hypothetical protein K8T91_22900 [Planctomycetes bacterium]|nr:hypothetical protein [Planctomycetota bacterium]